MARDTDQPDLFAGFAARDEALERVAANSGVWPRDALLALRRLPVGTEGTAEDFRLAMLRGGLRRPPDPHAWGALTNHARDVGLIEKTGELRPMRMRDAHARLTPVWRRV